MQPFSVVFFLASVCFASAFDKRIVRANGIFASRTNVSVISVNNGGLWGYWTWVDMCPEHSYAIGFSIKLEEYGGVGVDDTSLNGIRLFCSPEQTRNVMYTVESDTGDFGEWSKIRWCPQDGALNAFQLKVEPYQVVNDNTAANNIKFRCSNGVLMEEVGGLFGDYSEWSKPCPNGKICGIQTKQESYQGIMIDDTSLNDVRFFCCN
ncbi:vitelline membrane outer layer protein 1 homolog [Elgaria multicarinata webbii]|uniref:vitelline membrane outer layer protein 1 homolog n=1 Tax=Elgaria multicarinata webbii TaxID=159646 RepID=UPI002FCD3109